MRNLKICLILLLGVILLSISGLNAFANPEIVLRLGHNDTVTNVKNIAALQFADYVKNASDGRVEIQIFPDEQLGDEAEMIEQLISGVLELNISSQGSLSTINKKLGIFGLPFLFDSYEKAYAALDGEVGDIIANEFIEKGIRVLAYWDCGMRQITNNVRPINAPEDLKGMKIRTPPDEVTLAMFKALGASPAPLAWGELYLALSQHVFDGQENPITNIWSGKLYEVQKYLSLTNHKYECSPFIVSEKVWQGLPSDVQSLLKDAAMMYGEVNRKLNIQLCDVFLKKLEELGVKVNQADIQSMKAKTESVYKELMPVYGEELMNKILKVASGK